MNDGSDERDSMATLKSTAVIRLADGGGTLAEQLTAQFEAHEKEGVRTFLIDLDGVSYVNSSVLAILVRLKKRAVCNECQFQLFNISPHVMDILRTTRLQDFFFPQED